MIRYEFNENLQILEVFYINEVDLTSLIEYGEMIRQSKSLPRDLKILADATSAIYKLTPSEIHLLYEDMVKQIKPYKSVSTAVVQEKPMETALSLLIDNEKPILSYRHKVFSTREAALDWLIS